MKKIILVLLALALLVTACAQQPAAETAAPAAPAEIPAETPAAETPAAPAETPEEEPVALTPAAPADETPAAPAETPKAEEPAAKAPESDEQFFNVKEGDTVTYKASTFTVEDLTNSGNYMTLDFNPFRFHLYALNKPEILSGIEYTIVENNFNTQNSVKLRVRPLVLGDNEYLLERTDAVDVSGKKISLAEVATDSKVGEFAYVAINGTSYWAKVGTPVTAEKLEVTLLKAFYKQRQYAILKIVPA